VIIRNDGKGRKQKRVPKLIFWKRKEKKENSSTTNHKPKMRKHKSWRGSGHAMGKERRDTDVIL